MQTLYETDCVDVGVLYDRHRASEAPPCQCRDSCIHCFIKGSPAGQRQRLDARVQRIMIHFNWSIHACFGHVRDESNSFIAASIHDAAIAMEDLGWLKAPYESIAWFTIPPMAPAAANNIRLFLDLDGRAYAHPTPMGPRPRGLQTGSPTQISK